jgi:hypothetical protein
MVEASTKSVVQSVCFMVVAAASVSAAAQTYGDFTPVLTPAIGGVLQQNGDLSDGVEITTESFASLSNDVALECVPAGQQVKLLRFSLYTHNDGYQDIFFDEHSQPGVYSFESGLYVLTGFAPLVLIDTTTKANATRTVGGQQLPATGLKTYFSLESDERIPFYRTDAPVIPDSPPSGNHIAAQFVTWGWYDDYDIGTLNACQYIQIDGLPDGTYDLVVEENAARLLTSPIDGRLYDNVTSMRIKITGATVTPCTGDPATCPGPTVVDAAPRPIGPLVIAGPPGVVTRNTNTYDLFYVGTDGGLYTITQGTTGVWPSGSNGTLIFNSTAAGYPLAGGLAAIARDRVPMDVFGATTANDLVRLSWDGSAWHFT